MVLYTCKICLKEFNRKCNYINHTENKKTPCKPILQIPPTNPQNTPKNPQNPPTILQNTKEFPKDSVENNNFTCNFCFSSFKRKDHLKRHINERCKVKKLEDEKKENIFNSLIEKEKINNLFNMYEEIKKSNEEKNKIIEELNKKNDELNKKMKKLLKRIQGDYNRCKFMVHDGNNWNLSQNEDYDSSRIVQIGYICFNDFDYDYEVTEENISSIMIKPDGFIIPDDSIAIHKITNERANGEGIEIKKQ